MTNNNGLMMDLLLKFLQKKIEEIFAVSDGDHSGELGSDPVDFYIQQCQHLKEHTGIRLP